MLHLTVAPNSFIPAVSHLEEVSDVRVIRLCHNRRGEAVAGREELVYLHPLAPERDWPLFPSCSIKMNTNS